MKPTDINSFDAFSTKLTQIEKAMQDRDVVLDDQLNTVNRRSLRFRLLSLLRPFYIYFGYGDPFSHLKIENVARKLFTFLQEHKSEYVSRKILGDQVKGIWQKLDARTNRNFSNDLNSHFVATSKFFPPEPVTKLMPKPRFEPKSEPVNEATVKSVIPSKPKPVTQALSDFLQIQKLTYVQKRGLILGLLTEIKKRHETGEAYGNISLSTIRISEDPSSTKIKKVWKVSFAEEANRSYGTFGFLSPEMAKSADKVKSFESDIWSLGVVFSAIILGCSKSEKIANQNANNPAQKYEGALSKLPFLKPTYKCVVSTGAPTQFLQDFSLVTQEMIKKQMDELCKEVIKNGSSDVYLLGILEHMLKIDPAERCSANSCILLVNEHVPTTAAL